MYASWIVDKDKVKSARLLTIRGYLIHLLFLGGSDVDADKVYQVYKKCFAVVCFYEDTGRLCKYRHKSYQCFVDLDIFSHNLNICIHELVP